jgi:protein phosphatase
MPVRVAFATDKGQARPTNQDEVRVLVPGGGLEAVAILADGMGGHAAGNVASQIAVEEAANLLLSDSDSRSPDLRLASALIAANQTIFQASLATAGGRGMGTTLVMVAIQNREASVLNVGDSPAYLIRDGLAELISQDHSWPAEQARMGLISPEEVADHPFRHRLTRAVGIWETVPGYSAQVSLQDGDLLVLCSDGVESAGVTAHDMGQILEAAEGDLEGGVETVIQRCLEFGAPDNITIAVLRYSVRGRARRRGVAAGPPAHSPESDPPGVTNLDG